MIFETSRNSLNIDLDINHILSPWYSIGVQIILNFLWQGKYDLLQQWSNKFYTLMKFVTRSIWFVALSNFTRMHQPFLFSYLPHDICLGCCAPFFMFVKYFITIFSCILINFLFLLIIRKLYFPYTINPFYKKIFICNNKNFGK